VSPRPLDVAHIRKDFPVLEREFDGKPLVYLDSAATSQKPQAVIDAVSDFYANHNANVHRGVYGLAEEATAMFEGARAKLARFIGAPDSSTIVFNRGTTESMNLIAHSYGRKFLKEGDEIVLSELEHHSNIVPWQFCANATGATLRYIPADENGILDLSGLDGIITERTKIVSVTGMSNVLGTLLPLRELADAAHAVGAVIAVDGAQLVPHARVDVTELDIDFLTISGHKMCGPTASGGLYGRRELLEAMDPFLGGGEMISEVFHDHATWNEVPAKFEAGTPNIAQEVGFGAAIDYLEALGMDAIRDHERSITTYAIDRLTDAGARVFGEEDVEVRGGAVSFAYKEMHPHDLATILDEQGVCVRAGHHCAQLLMRRLGVPATTRASFYIYNTKEEVDALVEALAKAEDVFGF
jgi:cysteine desulfurase/selenocysteine lyase